MEIKKKLHFIKLLVTYQKVGTVEEWSFSITVNTH
jgi:hypothetical protein